MNDITNKLTEQVRPQLAIVIYASDGQWHDVYLESHVINEKGQLLEGKPLEQDTIQGMVDVFFDENKGKQTFTGMLPANMIQFQHRPGGRYHMVWYRPAERRHLHFVDSLNIGNGEAWVPPMLYVTDGRDLSVFAMATDERPTEETQLFLAPFHNVSNNGSVCLGSARKKKPAKMTYENMILYWEAMFWESEFSHLAHDTSPIKGNINILWKELIDDPSKTWAQHDVLLPSSSTIKRIIS